MSKKSFENLSEEQLIEKIARYEKKIALLLRLFFIVAAIALICFFITLAAGDAGALCVFAVTFVSGVVLFFMQHRLKNKTKEMVNEHLKDFYETELVRALGPCTITEEMQITQPFLKEIRVVERHWDKSFKERYYEGNYHGVHFSVTNVELCEVDDHPESEKPTYTTVFDGLVLRCKGICDPALNIAIYGKGEDHRQSDLISPAAFSQYFSARTADEQPAEDLVTPQLRELVQKLESVDNREMAAVELQLLRKNLERLESLDAKHRKPVLENDVREKIQKQEDNACYLPVTSLTIRGGEAILAINGYKYANGIQSDGSSMKNLDLIRKRFTASLYPVGRLIDVLQDYRGKI